MQPGRYFTLIIKTNHKHFIPKSIENIINIILLALFLIQLQTYKRHGELNGKNYK